MKNLLLSRLVEACSRTFGVSDVVFSESCFVNDGRVQKLANLQSFKDHLLVRREMRKEGETDMFVLCCEGSELSGPNDESAQRVKSSPNLPILWSSLELNMQHFMFLIPTDILLTKPSRGFWPKGLQETTQSMPRQPVMKSAG